MYEYYDFRESKKPINKYKFQNENKTFVLFKKNLKDFNIGS